jgi:Restriction endonuclease
MNWQSYEEITKDIYAVLGKGTGVKIECYGNSCKVTGKSGVEHQVDVLTSHSDGIHCYKTAIECKYWKDRINKDIVMKAEAIKNDCNLDKAVIVSQMGFTSDGLSYAEHVGIDLVELREPLDKDWEGRIKTICIQMHIRMPNLIKLKFPNFLSRRILTESNFRKY